MALLSYPFVAAGAATLTAAAGECLRRARGAMELNRDVSEGLLIAASYSEALLVRAACYLLVLPPVLCGLAFGWMLAMRRGIVGRITRSAAFRSFTRQEGYGD